MRTTPTCPMADLDICKHCRYSGNCEAEKIKDKEREKKWKHILTLQKDME